jgi:hypothetical protein
MILHNYTLRCWVTAVTALSSVIIQQTIVRAEIVTAPVNHGYCRYIDLGDDKEIGRNSAGTLIQSTYRLSEVPCMDENGTEITPSHKWSETSVIYAFCSTKYPLVAWGEVGSNRVSVSLLPMSDKETPPYMMLIEYHAYLFLCHGLADSNRSGANVEFANGYSYDQLEYNNSRLANRVRNAADILKLYQ